MKERILIIEDDKAIVRVLERALIYDGYDVDSASTGERGLELVREKTPSLIILDLMLRFNAARHGWDGGNHPHP